MVIIMNTPLQLVGAITWAAIFKIISWTRRQTNDKFTELAATWRKKSKPFSIASLSLPHQITKYNKNKRFFCGWRADDLGLESWTPICILCLYIQPATDNNMCVQTKTGTRDSQKRTESNKKDYTYFPNRSWNEERRMHCVLSKRWNIKTRHIKSNCGW